MAKGHRLFSAFWERMVRHEGPKERANRQYVVGGSRGRVLEIGLGVGANWRYLPPEVTYVGIEPDPFMRERAERHARESGRPFEIVDAGAERLPFEDDSFDTVIGTLVFCTVADVPRGLAEIRRVLKPDGEYRFWEHVRPANRISGKGFDLIQPAWSRIGGGCHPNRRTVEAIRAAGFELTDVRTFRRAVIPEVVGVAVRRP